MNRKQVGIIAEQVVVCDLLRQGYEVFTSVSDNSRVDVVPLNKKTGRIAKIQVKSTSTLTSNDSITFRIKKAGYFNYSYTCLLYTSPSPRDVEESRMPSSA